MLESSVDGADQQRRCVACGFSETMDPTSGPSGIMPRARFERSRAAPAGHQPVKILDPGSIKRSSPKED